MAQYKSKDIQTITYPRRVTSKVDNVTLDSSRGINNPCFVIVNLDDGEKFEFPVPTFQEIKDRFLYKKAQTQPNIPARPPNKFFIFRTMLQRAIDDYKFQVPIVSSLASEAWNKCSPEVVELFTKLSQIAKCEHAQINPGYVYKPNRSKSRITKNRTQEKSYEDFNNSSSLILNDLPSSFSLPLWTTASKLNYYGPQDYLYGIPSQSNLIPNENSVTIEDSAHDIQARYAYQPYLTNIDPSITSPLETINVINDPYQQFYQYPTKNLFYPNNDNNLSMDYNQDVNALMQPNPTLTSIPHYLPPTFDSPSEDISPDVLSFHAEQS